MLPLGTSDVTYVALEAETIDATMVQIRNFIAVGYYLASRAVDEKLQREMISVAAQRVKLTSLPSPEGVFDCSFAQKVVESFR